jgi:hypothetical protein
MTVRIKVSTRKKPSIVNKSLLTRIGNGFKKERARQLEKFRGSHLIGGGFAI